MFNKKRIIIFVAFILLMFFMMTFAGTPVQNASIATREVIFTDGYNGRNIASYEVEVGKDATVPEVPKHENYVFAGWYEYDNRDNRINSFNTILKDTHAIALYGEDLNHNEILDSNEEHFIVTFINTIDGGVIKEEEVLIGMDATAPEAPVVSGYSFAGWDKSYRNVREDLTISTVYNEIRRTNVTPNNNPNNDDNDNNDNNDDNNNGNQNDAITYNVTFIDGENDKIISVVKVEEGLSVTTPSVPTHENRVFDKWEGNYTDVRKDETVVAIYTDDKNGNGEKDYLESHFTVRFKATGKGHLEGKLEYNGILTGLTFEEAGIKVPTIVADEYYEFNKWDKEFTKVTEDTTYTASFKATNDEISPDGGSDSIADQEQDYTLTINYVFTDGKHSIESKKETRKYSNRDYEYTSPIVNHYNVDKDTIKGTIGSDGKLDKVETITYTRKEYTVTFISDEKIIKTEKVLAEESATAPENPTKENTSEYIYTFIKWDTDFSKIIKDTDVKAEYSSAKQKYNVVVNPNCENENGCEINPDDPKVPSEPVEYGTEITLPGVKRENTLSFEENAAVPEDKKQKPVKGYAELKGYCTKETCTDEELIDAGTKVKVEKDVTYKAVWDESKLTVSFKDGVGYETKAEKATFTRWKDESGKVVNEKEIKLTKDVKLTATYNVTPQKYTVEVNPNCENENGCVINPDDPEVPSEPVEYGEEITLPEITREYTLSFEENSAVADDKKHNSVKGYGQLKGYCDKDSCTDSELVKAGTKVKVEKDVTYKAIWDESKLTVSFKDGASYETKAEKATFTGWKDESGKVVSEREIKLTKDIKLTATYDTTPQKYNVIVNPNCTETACGTTKENEYTYGTEITLPEITREYTLSFDENPLVPEDKKQEPVKGYAQLKGYCEKDSCTDSELITAGTKVTVEKDVTYKAVWDDSKLTVSFKDGASYETEKLIATFAQWENESGKVVNEREIKLTKDVKIKAIYNTTPQKYDVVVNPNCENENGCVINPNDPGVPNEPVEYGTEITLPEIKREYTLSFEENASVPEDKKQESVKGYAELKGYCDKDSCTDSELVKSGTKVKVEKDVTYKAVWDDSKLTVSFKDGAGYETKAEKATFTGWKDESEKVVNERELKLTKDVKLTATYDTTPQKYNVVVNPNCTETACGTTKENEYTYGTEITLPEITREYTLSFEENVAVPENKKQKSVKGYAELKGYCEKNSCTDSELITAGTKVTVEKDVTYKAVWDESKLTVKYNLGANYDSPKYKGVFDHWEDESGKKVEYEGRKLKLSSDTVFTAKYTFQDQYYKLTVNTYLDGEFNKKQEINVKYDTTVNSNNYVESIQYYKFDHADKESLTISDNYESNIINLYYVSLDANVTITPKFEGKNPSEYGDVITYSFTITNTGNDTAEVKLKDLLLGQALKDGNIVFEDGTDSKVYSILDLESNDYKVLVEPGKEKAVTFKVVVKAQAGATLQSQISYSVNGAEKQTTEVLTIDVEKTISYVEQTESTKGSNIIIVLDKSASMDDDGKLDKAKEATVSYIKNSFTETGETNGSVIYVTIFGTKPILFGSPNTPYADNIGSAKNYNESLELINNVNALGPVTSWLGSGTPYYKGLERAYELLFNNNEIKNNGNKNVVIFLTDGEPDSTDNKEERNKYIKYLKNNNVEVYSIGYGDITKDSNAYKILKKISGDKEENTFIATTETVTQVFDTINGRVKNTKTSLSSKGVASIGTSLDVSVNHPLIIKVNNVEKYKFTSLESAIDSKVLIGNNIDGYKVDATKFDSGSSILVSFYVPLNN